ncbi:MAG: hypothetical protein JJU11_09935 [Candidatus Sumerlaeia bacterium]|nr:hypothetical protein [Candidatus Sumerlaeia bacterium]
MKRLIFTMSMATLLASQHDAFAQNPGEPLDRVAAWQRTLIAQNDTHPNKVVMTYITEGMENSRQWVLAKISPSLEGYPASSVTNGDAIDFPGGITGTWKWGGINGLSQIAPVLTPRIDDEWSGGAVYTIETNPPTPVTLNIGGGYIEVFHVNPVENMVSDQIAFPGNRVEARQNSTLVMTADVHPFVVVIKANDGVVEVVQSDEGDHARVHYAEGMGELLIAFAETEEHAMGLLNLSPTQALEEVEDYYEKLLGDSYIKTPEEQIDGAFRSALLLNEYCYFEPLGWIEGVHHWVTLWHQQYTGMAHWAGQHERSRQNILETVARLMPDGAIPHMQPTGKARHDWGGANHFFAWQVMEYYKATGDGDLLVQILPELRRMIQNTRDEYDTTGNSLIAWGTQVGNQEDFLGTSFQGTASSAEFLNILEVVALAERLAGNATEAALLRTERNRTAARMRDHLFDGNLGVPIFSRDDMGNPRVHGQHLSMIHPVLTGMLDPIEVWNAMRFLSDRLTGPYGETYVSNQFPDHLPEHWSTWGMQAGVAQQPWAAWAYNRVGRTEDAIRPLRAAASWVFNDIQRGTWPEVAHEIRPGYFSPPAALYFHSVVEAIFGFQANLPEDALVLRPAFPRTWPEATLALPEWKGDFQRDGSHISYRVQSDRLLKRQVRWPLPTGSTEVVRVNGSPVDFEIMPGAGGVELYFVTEPTRDSLIEFTWKELDAEVHGPGSIALGDRASFHFLGTQINAVHDPSGLFRMQQIDGDMLHVELNRGLLDEYLPYGRLGQIAFSRRSFFVTRTFDDGTRVVEPVDILLLPPFEATATDVAVTSTGATVHLTVRNNTSSRVEHEVLASAFGSRTVASIHLDARSEGSFDIHFEGARPTPGENLLALTMDEFHDLETKVLVDGDEYTGIELVAVPLPANLTITDEEYLSWRNWYGFYTSLFAHLGSLMDAVKELDDVTVPALPGVSFGPTKEGLLIPVGNDRARSSVVIPIDSDRNVVKVYLLTFSVLMATETFSPVAQVELVHPKLAPIEKVGSSRTVRRLHVPGDLDWCFPFEPIPTVFALSSFQGNRESRHGLLPLLTKEDADWSPEISAPLSFPQPEFWSDSAVLSTSHAIFNVIEMEPGVPRPVESIVIRPLGQDAVMGVVGIAIAYESTD